MHFLIAIWYYDELGDIILKEGGYVSFFDSDIVVFNSLAIVQAVCSAYLAYIEYIRYKGTG